jgi:uncharacterized protein YxeA
MKKHHYIFSIIILTILIAGPIVTNATELDHLSVLGRINNVIDSKGQDIKNNQDARDNKLERLYGSTTQSTTKNGPRMYNGSTTTNIAGTSSTSTRNENRQNNRNENAYRNNGKEMLSDAFHARKKNIEKQLQNALNNLKQIRERINSRITKATASGRDMTKAKSLLTIADNKITVAQNTINNLIKSLTATSTATSTASTTVDLTKPRAFATDAQKAIKSAQKALVDVVVAIAHAMGLKIGNNYATSTQPINATTTTATTTIATSTATTTNQ